MKKPYLKNLGDFSNFKIWIVNGKYVRENLNREFTNFGQYSDYKFIPKKEFWIDQENSGNETKFFLTNMIVQNKLISMGKSFDYAHKKAELAEKKEREKSTYLKNALKKIKHKPELLKRIHKKLLKKYSKEKIKVWIVNGELVRDLFFLDFTEGGNDQIYSFVPYGEIWLDDDLSPKELKFVLLHELHERNLMKKGWKYDSFKRGAHYSANEIEYFCRKFPQFTDAKIKEEIRNFKL